MADPVLLSPADLAALTALKSRVALADQLGYAGIQLSKVESAAVFALLDDRAALTAAREEAEALTEDWRQVVDRIDERNEALEAALLAAEHDRDRRVSLEEITAIMDDWPTEDGPGRDAIDGFIGLVASYVASRKAMRALASPPPSPEGEP